MPDAAAGPTVRARWGPSKKVPNKPLSQKSQPPKVLVCPVSVGDNSVQGANGNRCAEGVYCDHDFLLTATVSGVTARLMRPLKAVPLKGCDNLACTDPTKFRAHRVTAVTSWSLVSTSDGSGSPCFSMSSRQHLAAS